MFRCKAVVLDLRIVNSRLKYEELRTALSYLEKYYWMIKWDIHSAFHFCDMFGPHTAFLGFSWPESNGVVCYYKLLVLPFGIRTATYWFLPALLLENGEERVKKVIMYLVDGFGCGEGKINVQKFAQDIKTDLILSGFIPKVDKSLWEPVQELTWLGAVLNSIECSISIPQVRTEKLIHFVNELQLLLQKKTLRAC